MTRQVLVDAEALERLLSPREARRMWGGPGAPLGIEKQCRYCEFPHDAHAEGCPVPVLQAALAQPTPAPAEAPATGTLDWYKNLCWVLDHVLAGDEASLPPGVFHLHRKDGLILKVLNLLARAEAAEAERARLLTGLEGLRQLVNIYMACHSATETERLRVSGLEHWQRVAEPTPLHAKWTGLYSEEMNARDALLTAVCAALASAGSGMHVISLEHDEESSQRGMREAAERVARSVLSRTEGEEND